MNTGLNLIFTALVPILVAGIAGLLRQDKYSYIVNEIISYAVVLILSGFSAYLDGKLITNNIGTTALIIIAYAAASLNTGPYVALQSYIQANIFRIGPQISKPGANGQPILDPQALAKLVASELSQNAPAIMAVVNTELTKLLRAQSSRAQDNAAAAQVATPRASLATNAVRPGSGVMANQRIDQIATQSIPTVNIKQG